MSTLPTMPERELCDEDWDFGPCCPKGGKALWPLANVVAYEYAREGPKLRQFFADMARPKPKGRLDTDGDLVTEEDEKGLPEVEQVVGYACGAMYPFLFALARELGSDTPWLKVAEGRRTRALKKKRHGIWPPTAQLVTKPVAVKEHLTCLAVTIHN